jgi:hypothetical protein
MAATDRARNSERPDIGSLGLQIEGTGAFRAGTCCIRSAGGRRGRARACVARGDAGATNDGRNADCRSSSFSRASSNDGAASSFGVSASLTAHCRTACIGLGGTRSAAIISHAASHRVYSVQPSFARASHRVQYAAAPTLVSERSAIGDRRTVANGHKHRQRSSIVTCGAHCDAIDTSTFRRPRARGSEPSLRNHEF